MVTSSCRMQVMTTGPVLFLNKASPSLYDPNGAPSSLHRMSPDSIPAACSESMHNNTEQNRTMLDAV